MFEQGLIPDPTEQGKNALHEAVRHCMQSYHCATGCVLTDSSYLAAVAATAILLAFWATPIGLFGSLQIKVTLVTPNPEHKKTP